MRRPATSTCCTIARLIKCGDGARENLLDHGRLRIRVVLYVLPLLRAELALRPRIELAVRFVRAQPIAEEQHSVNLGTLRWKDMQVHGWFGAAKHPVLEPVRLANAENVTHRLKLRDVRLLVRRVGDDEVDVDERLCHQARHRGRADVVDLKCRPTERASNLFGCLVEERRPARVVLNEHDLLVGRHFTDRCGPDLFVSIPLEYGRELCHGICPQEPSRFSSPTWRARRSCCTNWARMPIARPCSSIAASCATRSPAMAASRLTRKGTRSSSPSPPDEAQSTRRVK